MTKNSLGKTDALPINKFIQEEQNDANGRRIETSAEDSEKFLKVQENMNTHTAIAKGYGTTCERLKLDPKKPLKPGQYSGQMGPETELKAHQVVALDWLLQKLIDGALLADDMGLGETITALFVIPDNVYQHEMQKVPALEVRYCVREDLHPSFIGFDATHAWWLEHGMKALIQYDIRGWISSLYT